MFEFCPGDFDFGFVSGNTVKERKLSTASKPGEKQPEYYRYYAPDYSYRDEPE